MTVAEVAGYVAAALVFATFYMRTMIPLRVVGIASNIAFLLYGSMAGLVPILVLHGALLPLNLWRLQQIRALVREVRRTAAGDLPIEVLMPFMATRHVAAGEILFRRGEAARQLYYLASGAIRLLELDKTLTPGALLGEISLFAPTSERTATAICDGDVKLYTITADKVMQLYYQNPRFGFHVVRLITARLIENVRRQDAAPPGDRQLRVETAPVLGDQRPASIPSVEAQARRRRLRLVRLGAGAVAALALLAAGWQLAPYLRSTVVRDSAVTSWIHLAASPIIGQVDSRLPKAGDRIGADGRILTIRNAHSDPSAAEHAAAEVTRAAAIVEELRRYVDSLRQLDAAWRARTVEHARAFKRQLDVALTSARLELEQVNQRLALARAERDRKQRLVKSGNASLSAVEESQALVAELELLRVERERSIAELQVRAEAAEQGVYVTADGTDPGWADRSRDELQRDLARGESNLAESEAKLAEAQRAASIAAAALEQTTVATVTGPPDSLIWSVVVGASTAVATGSPLVEWLDCSVMLVDVPVSDIMVALLRPDMRADVVLEGENEMRRARILLTRGAAGALGRDDLAAVAKGQAAGRGQVLLQLEPTPADIARCPIGLSAFVDFPEVSALDMLRARLRL